MSRLSFLAPISIYLLSFALTPTTTATPAPFVNGDPCGPVVQDFPNYPNTCSVAPALAESPQPYAVNCTATVKVQGYQTVSWQNCSASYEDACLKALDARTRKAVWIWSSLADGCALGFFLPPYPGSAQLLNYTRCIEIFTAMNDTCSTVVPVSNYGGVNLRTIPGYPPSIVDGQAVYDGWPRNNYTFLGDAVNVGYPSYAISYLPLTVQY